MRKIAWVVLLILAAPAAALAHGHNHHYWGCGHHGYRLGPLGPPAAARPLPSRAASLEGAIQEVYSPEGMTGQRMDLESNQGTITVFLGPRWFLEQEGWTLNKGDRVRVEGWWEDDVTVVAREIRFGDRTLRLRGPNMEPRWSGRRR